MTLLKSALFGAAMAALLASFAMRSEPAPPRRIERPKQVTLTENVFDAVWAKMLDPVDLTKADRELLPVTSKVIWPNQFNLDPIVTVTAAAPTADKVRVAGTYIPEDKAKAVEPKKSERSARKSCKRVKVFHHGKYWWRCKR